MKMVNITNSKLLLVFIALILFFNAFPVTNAADAIDFNGATKHWLTLNANSFNGTCLNASKRIDTYSVPIFPLYTQVLTLDSGNWPSHLLHTWIAKILLQETIGYSVKVNDKRADPSTRSLQRTSSGSTTANIEFWNDNTTLSTQYFSVLKTSTNAGPLGILGNKGVYISSTTVSGNSDLILEFWRSWIVNQNQIVSLFLNDTWKYIKNPFTNTSMIYSLDDNGQKEYVCRNDSNADVYRTDCQYSMVIPPVCYPDPSHQCAVIYHYSEDGMDALVDLIQNLNLPLVIAWIDPATYQDYILALVNTFNANLLVYGKAPGIFDSTSCTNNVTNASYNCFTRLGFQTNSKTCDGSNGGNITCDFPITEAIKVTTPSIATTAPRANNYFREMEISTEAINSMLERVSESSIATVDYKRIACDWIISNENTWSSWITPPYSCLSSDATFVIQNCDVDTGTRRVSWSWKAPKSCASGRSDSFVLPTDDTIPCDTISTKNELFPVYMLFPLLLTVLCICIPATYTYYSMKKFRIRLRILHLSGTTIYYHFGALIALNAMTMANYFSITENICIMRLVILTLAAVVLFSTLHVMITRLYAITSRLLVSKTSLRQYGMLAGILTANFAFVIAVAATTEFLGSQSSHSEGGAPYSAPSCDVESGSKWIIYILLVGNLIWISLGAIRLVQLIYRLHLDRRMYKGKHASTFVTLKVQAITLFFTFLMQIVGFIMYMDVYYLKDTIDNATVAIEGFYTNIAFVASNIVFLFGPSVAHHYHLENKKRMMAREKDTDDENSKSSKSDSSSMFELTSLSTCLSDPVALMYFKQFSSTVCLEPENLAFLEAVQKLVNMLKRENVTVFQVLDGVQETYAEFIADGSNLQVNLSNKQRNEVEQDINELVKTANKLTNPRSPSIKAKMEDDATLSPLPATGAIKGSTDESPKATDLALTPNGIPGATLQFSHSSISAVRSPNSIIPIFTTISSSPMASMKKNSTTTTPFTGLGTKIATKEFKGKAKIIFDAATREVLNLMKVNSFPRFLASKLAERCNEIFQWASGFDLFKETEKPAILARINKQLQSGNRSRTDASSQHTFNSNYYLDEGVENEKTEIVDKSRVSIAAKTVVTTSPPHRLSGDFKAFPYQLHTTNSRQSHSWVPEVSADQDKATKSASELEMAPASPQITASTILPEASMNILRAGSGTSTIPNTDDLVEELNSETQS